MGAAHLRQGPPAPDGEATRPKFVPGCSGKVRHSRREATATLLRRGAGQIYSCPHCFGWHTTGVPANAPRRKDQAL